jgi:hypothetical protein
MSIAVTHRIWANYATVLLDCRDRHGEDIYPGPNDGGRARSMDQGGNQNVSTNPLLSVFGFTTN